MFNEAEYIENSREEVAGEEVGKIGGNKGVGVGLQPLVRAWRGQGEHNGGMG